MNPMNMMNAPKTPSAGPAWLRLVGAAALLASAAALVAQPQGNPDMGPPPPPMGPPPAPHRQAPEELETVAFLGVDVSPASGALTDQLGLPENTGLVVDDVKAGSPAAGVLKAHDVLTKLDEQTLIDPHQFAVIVRNHHPGDEVTLAYIRGGKPATATVKLGEKREPKLGDWDAYLGPLIGRAQQMGKIYSQQFVREMQKDAQLMRQDAERFRQQMQSRMRDRGEAGDGLPPNVDLRLVLPGQSGLTIELSIQNGKKTLTVTGPDQKIIFSGPVDTRDERRALSAEVARDLDRLEHLRGIHLDANAPIPPPPPVAPAPPAPPAAPVTGA